MNTPKILFLDIETIPDFLEVIKIWCGISAYPGLSLKASITSILCIGYKWLDDPKTHCINAWDFPEWKKDINKDKRVVEEFLKIYEQADAIVTHNGKSFDLKHIKTRAMKHGFPSLAEKQHIDTKNEVKKHLYMFNNRLGTIGDFLVGDKKLENGGWQLWVDVYNRIPKAQKLMTEYCKQDVILLEKVFLKIRPYISSIPNYGLFQVGAYKMCPSCGSTRVKKDGVRVQKSGIQQRYRCNECGTLSHSKKEKKDLILK
jgi:DNA polymerase elongation subunit (family B)